MSFHLLASLYTNVLQISLLSMLFENSVENISQRHLFSDELITNRKNNKYLERLTLVCDRFEYKRVCYNAGIWNFRFGHLSSSTTLLSQLYEKNTRDELLIFYLGASQWASGDKNTALEAWRKTQGIDNYFAIKGDILFKLNMPQEAFVAWEISDKIDDTLSIQKTNMYVALCEMWRDQGDVQDSLKWCEKAVTVNSSWPVHFAVVQSLLDMGQLDRSLQIAQSLIQRESDLTFSGRNQAHRLLGQVYVANDDYLLAIEQYNLIVQPDQFTLFELSQVYLEANLMNEAVSILQEIVRIDPTTNVAKQAQNQLDNLISP